MSFYCDVSLVVADVDVQRACDEIIQLVTSAGIGVSIDVSGKGCGPIPEEATAGSADGERVCLTVLDSPSSNDAGYLLDNRDFAPGSDIGLPVVAIDRLGILLSFLLPVMAADWCQAISVALSDSDEIERTSIVSAEDFASRVYADCAIVSPPNVLYRIDRSLTNWDRQYSEDE
jgi:hypothetical protein